MSLTHFWNSLTRRQVEQSEREDSQSVHLFGGIAQERVYVGVHPQVPPDQPRQGVETPSRPARMPIAILTGMNPQAVAEGRFLAGVPDNLVPMAAYPLARQIPQRERVNIPVPPHIALGSYFEAWEGQYG